MTHDDGRRWRVVCFCMCPRVVCNAAGNAHQDRQQQPFSQTCRFRQPPVAVCVAWCVHAISLANRYPGSNHHPRTGAAATTGRRSLRPTRLPNGMASRPLAPHRQKCPRGKHPGWCCRTPPLSCPPLPPLPVSRPDASSVTAACARSFTAPAAAAQTRRTGCARRCRGRPRESCRPSRRPTASRRCWSARGAARTPRGSRAGPCQRPNGGGGLWERGGAVRGVVVVCVCVSVCVGVQVHSKRIGTRMMQALCPCCASPPV